MEQIGVLMNLTRDRIRQLKERALRKLRHARVTTFRDLHAARRLKFNPGLARCSRPQRGRASHPHHCRHAHPDPHDFPLRLKRSERSDEANAQDPRHEVCEGHQIPKELLYARRLSQWLQQVAPEASEALRLAARAQHRRAGGKFLVPIIRWIGPVI